MDCLPRQQREYEARRIHGTPRSPNADFLGRYWSEEFRMSLDVDDGEGDEKVEGILSVTINGLRNQRKGSDTTTTTHMGSSMTSASTSTC